MVKWILLLLLGVVAYLILRKPQRVGDRPKGAAEVEERVVPCARCGVNVPESESVVGVDGKTFCCVEHRLAGPADRRS